MYGEGPAATSFRRNRMGLGTAHRTLGASGRIRAGWPDAQRGTSRTKKQEEDLAYAVRTG